MKCVRVPALLTLFLLASSALLMTSSACPSECDCVSTEGGTMVHCRYQKLKTIPFGIPEDTIEIDFGHNSIRLITSTSFPTLPLLKRLLMDWCQIERVDDYAFAPLGVSLEYLELSHNNIRELQPKAFRNLRKLKTLRLDYNHIPSLPELLFENLSLQNVTLKNNAIESLADRVFSSASVVNINLDENSISNITDAILQPLRGKLKHFHLSHNKKPLAMEPSVFDGFLFADLTLSYSGLRDPTFLKHVQAHSLDISGQRFIRLDFRDCPNLRLTEEFYLRNLSIDRLSDSLMSNMAGVRLLDLSQNDLYTLDGELFRYVPLLKRLHLNENQFTSLPENFGTHLSGLEVLTVSMNKLVSVRPDAFEGMNSLKELDIRNNRIQVFEESMQPVFTGLSRLMLGGNPLHCNCEVKWFRNWLESYGSPTGADDCFTPRFGNIYHFNTSAFVCRAPSINNISPSLNIEQGDNIYLTCGAEGDPAPEVQWTSPRGEIISVTPPFNRSRHKTHAIWHLKRLQVEDGGWYKCRASNLEGSMRQYTYLHIYEEGEATVDVNAITLPVTTAQSITVTSSEATLVPPATGSVVATTTTPQSTSSATKSSTPGIVTPSISNSRVLTTNSAPDSKLTTTTLNDVTSHSANMVTGTPLLHDASTDNELGQTEAPFSPPLALPTWAIIAIAIAIGSVVLVIILIVSIVHCLRRRRYMRQYQPGRIYYRRKT